MSCKSRIFLSSLNFILIFFGSVWIDINNARAFHEAIEIAGGEELVVADVIDDEELVEVEVEDEVDEVEDELLELLAELLEVEEQLDELVEVVPEDLVGVELEEEVDVVGELGGEFWRLLDSEGSTMETIGAAEVQILPCSVDLVDDVSATLPKGSR